MSDDPSQIHDMLSRSRRGDADAAEWLFRAYAKRLIGVADQNLAGRLASRVDAEDIVQSVFRTFFRRNAQGDFHIDSSVDLWRLLAKITLLKTRAVARFHSAKLRDVNAEAGVGDEWIAEAAATEPGPAEAALLLDQIEALLAGLPETYREILLRRLEGHDAAAIAIQLGLSRRTIQRGLNLLRDRLKTLENPS